MRLKKKERRYVSEFLVDQDQTKAAIRAGYSKRSARQIASRLMTKDDIIKAIDEKTKVIENKNEISAERLDRTLLALAEADIRQAFNPDGTIKPMAEIPDDVAKAISSVEVDEDGNVLKFKLAEKARPVELLLKRHKFLVDRHEHTGKDGKPLVAPVTLDLSRVSDKTLEKLADMMPDASAK